MGGAWPVHVVRCILPSAMRVRRSLIQVLSADGRALAVAAVAGLGAACNAPYPNIPSTPVDSGASGTTDATVSRRDGGRDATVDARASKEAARGGDVSVAYDVSRYEGLHADAGPARVPVHAELVSDRAIVGPLMFAAGEMQISGEPFASGFAGRNLADYDREWLPPDM